MIDGVWEGSRYLSIGIVNIEVIRKNNSYFVL